MSNRVMLALLAGIGLLASSQHNFAGAQQSAEAQQANATERRIALWPRRTAPPLDAAIEARISRIMAAMTLEQKIGQMTQAEIRSITPEQARRFHIGSILNGGGAWPSMNKRSTVQDWINLSDAFYRASPSLADGTTIPIIWGTDAVHGHNNVHGATLFPHNIGLGAANNPALVERIGRSTARATRATGITWVFAPTVAVVQNQRWGRTYESYSSDPAVVRRNGAALVRGLQGNLNGADDVLASVKHFIGDGATHYGVDQGLAWASQRTLVNTHAQGFFGALDANVQTVMISYSSWTDADESTEFGKMHGNRYLINDVLKERLGFDGLVVSDWNAIEQVSGCARAHCPQAINAGIDMVMVPDDWEAFITNTIADVRGGRIPMARIDDAVRRILRVKLRSGLFDSNPATSSARPPASAIEDRALARDAVRQSLVLLKNDGGVLPLSRASRVLVVGGGADSFSHQAGGWSRTWQGTENVNEDFATGQTLLAAIRETLGDAQVTYSETGQGVDVARFDAVIAVLAEDPYAEMRGDIRWPARLTHSERYQADAAVLAAVSGRGRPVISVLYSGRTTHATDLINRSDAFVAAWLPGTEAGGIADLLFRTGSGRVAYDFRGRLPFAWPGDACDDLGQRALFRRGYGLTYRAARRVGRLPERISSADCPTLAGGR